MLKIDQPFWKRVASYLVEWHIESAPSDINPHLYVSLKNGRYQLSTANSVYSFSDLYDNFKITFQKIKLPPEGSHILILGFGLGSIPILLEKIHQKKYYYTAIEIDENVLYLANKYVIHQLQSSINLICTDALIYVQQCKETFDFICVDLFLDDSTPKVFRSFEFLKSLRPLLTPQGNLCYNCLADTKEDILATQSFYNNEFLNAFPLGTTISTRGNRVLINKKNALL
ncbi:MAG: class I SAM-dependent methyltransferase [Saprospiraceae bacterium]|nr:class I SAM-dependent methyltransferase [Saprospiraceae bacterium]